jgi:TonB-linked SusC/RagA family outer membrane protein
LLTECKNDKNLIFFNIENILLYISLLKSYPKTKNMKKIVFVMLCMVLFLGTVIAQKTTVRGKVTDLKGAPIPSATVREKGTQNAVSADADGVFAISADSKAILQISATGFALKEVSAGNASNVSLAEAVDNLSEVVVTALGIRREKKALGYSVQEIKGENLTVAKSIDVSSSIVGKVAGVQLVGSPSSTFDNASILVRGVTGLDIAPPIFVVDGTITDQSNVIMDNVENLSVLKGPAATALYGQRAANGVVMIQMKKGTRKKMTSVDVNLGFTSESIALLPPYQNQYAGGYTSNYTTKRGFATGSAPDSYDDKGFYIFRYNPAVHPTSWAAFNGHRMLEYGADESWGPKIDGTDYRAYWSWYPGAEFGLQTPLTAQPNNVKDFFQNGRNLNNSVSLTSSAESYNFRFTYGNQNRTLIIPGAKRDQHQLGLNGSFDISKVISLSTDMVYTFAKKTGQPTEGYNLEGRNITQNFNQWFQRQLDMQRMKVYREPDGSLNSWNIGDPNTSSDISSYGAPQYWDNPYFVLNETYGTENSNRLAGNLGLNIKITPHLNLQSNVRLDQYQFLRDFRVGAGGLQLNSYEERQRIDREMNYETNLMYRNKFGKFSIDALLGGNIRNWTYDEMFWRTEGGLSAPNYYVISASIARPTTTRDYRRKKVNSFLGKVSVGYKDLLYVEATTRRDANSALPENNNTFYYPSFSTSFIFSELLKNTGVSSWLTYGKLRASYASVGSDLAPHSVAQGIDNSSLYGSNPSNAIGNQYRSGNIIPALTSSYEVGVEFKFFKRIGFEGSWYQNNNTNQIIPLTVSPTSGFSTAQVNAGNIQNSGIELSINGTPVMSRNFTWDVSLNWATNKNKVIELYGTQENYVYATDRFDTRLEHRKNGEWGTYVSRKWRTDPTKGGQYLIQSTGLPEYDINKDIGTVLPKWTGGMFNSFRYKGFDLTFSIDFQSGGLFYSETRNFNTGSGLSQETVGVNDKGFDWREYPGAYTTAGGSAGTGGIRVPGVFSTGALAGAANNRYIPARSYWYTARQRDASNYLLDASYIKLREVRLGYAIPASALAGLKVVKNANIGLIISNAWLMWANAKQYGIDPSELEVFYREGGQLSSTRQIGLNLRVGF